MYFSEKATIEANKRNVGIHLINHSCSPNTFMYTYKRHCLYIALRKIFKREELTVHYCISGPDNECDPCTHKCHCASPLCFGTMHIPDEIYVAWENYFTEQERGQPHKPPVSFGTNLPMLDKYPSSIRDQNIFPIFSNWKKKPLVAYNKSMPTLSQIRKSIRVHGKPIILKKLGIVVEGIIGKRIIARKYNS
jgi:hypothetical protein